MTVEEVTVALTQLCASPAALTAASPKALQDLLDALRVAGQRAEAVIVALRKEQQRAAAEVVVADFARVHNLMHVVPLKATVPRAGACLWHARTAEGIPLLLDFYRGRARRSQVGVLCDGIGPGPAVQFRVHGGRRWWDPADPKAPKFSAIAEWRLVPEAPPTSGENMEVNHET